MTKPANQFSRFVRANGEVKQRIIGASFGDPGTGKTSFWLSAPGPIVVQSLDKGLEGVVEKFQVDKEIYLAEYNWSPTEELSQDDAIGLRDKFIEDFEHAIQHARTVVWDKETDVWELFRYAEFGAPSDSPRNYPALNQRYRRYVNMPKDLDINFGMIQGMKSRWISKPDPKTGALKGFDTGERVRQGFSDIDGLVHLNLYHRREPGRFIIEVGKARGPGGQDVQDQTFESLTFPEFAQLVFPESEESDWV